MAGGKGPVRYGDFSPAHKKENMRKIKFRFWDGGRMRSWDDVKECLGFHHWIFDPPAAITPMQFTGLLDKNGVEIYEGDICRVTAEIQISNDGVDEMFGDTRPDIQEGLFKVLWRDEFACFDLKLISGELGAWGFYGKDDSGEYEVIGNIHQNPELLEAK